ncbi:hypothetical protein [Naasia aerilata]|nr:hypothetical protein [Naasia aerilata]
MRILLRVQHTDLKASFNFGLVGAAVELGAARATYEIQGVGIGAVFADILSDLPGVGTFNYSTYLKISGPVQNKVAKFIEANREKLVPQPVAVALARPLDPLASARAVYFAMYGLAGRSSLKDILSVVPLGVDKAAVGLAYEQVAGHLSPDERPSETAQREARVWLNR